MDYIRVCLRGDIAFKLCEYLNPPDIINFVRVFKPRRSLEKSYYESIMSGIEKILQKVFGDKFDEIKEKMMTNKAVISGSLILQVILGEKWENSDIDIFIPTNFEKKEDRPISNTRFFTQIEDYFYKHFSEQIEYTPDPLPRYNFWNQHMRKIKRIQNYKLSEKIQLILVPILSNQLYDNFICKAFDFTVCKNIFYYEKDRNKNGIDIIVPKIKISNIRQIWIKKTAYNPDLEYHGEPARKRILKYKERGFTFHRSDSYFNRLYFQ